MRPKGIEDLAAFSAREVKRSGAKERDECSSAEGQWESKSSQRAFGKLKKSGGLLGLKAGKKGIDRRIGR